MKGNITSIEKAYNPVGETLYVLVIEINELPKLKLGNCEVIQYEN